MIDDERTLVSYGMFDGCVVYVCLPFRAAGDDDGRPNSARHSSQHKMQKKVAKKRPRDKQQNAQSAKKGKASSPKLITQHSFADKSLLAFIPKLRKIKKPSPLVKQLLSEIDYLEDEVPLGNPNRIREEYEKHEKLFMDLVPGKGNRGQGLTKIPQGLITVMCFATNECLKYLSHGIANRMNLKNKSVNMD